jgi:hypothetical protein
MKRLPRLLRPLRLLALCLTLVCAACGDDDHHDSDALLSATEIGRVALRPQGEARADDLTNRFLSPGRSFEVRQYEVPALRCVRTDSDDFLHIPDVTTSPGAPAVFWAVAPADPSQPVLITFHGNGLDFIEALASLLALKSPLLVGELLAADPGMAGYIEILNRGGALRGLVGEFGNAAMAEALERGWGVVVPGNCWGDGGFHDGEVIDYYIRAPRYGHTMDQFVWDWYRQRFPHDRSREYSFGCSGGGQRTAQLLLHDPLAVAASLIDSPADYLPGFQEQPPGLFALLAGVPGAPAVFDAFYTGHYGSLAAAGDQSLGAQLLARGIGTPIYLSYSDEDTFTTHAVTRRLAEALSARQPADRSMMWNTGEAVHCQLNTRDRARTAVDWVAGWRREDWQ